MLKSKTNVVQAIEETVSSEGIHLKRNRSLAVRSDDLVVFEVNSQLKTCRRVRVKSIKGVLGKFKG